MASGGSSNGGGSVWGAGGATAAERLKAQSQAQAQAQAAAPAAAGAGGNGGAQAAAAGGFMKARLAYLLTNLVGETVELTVRRAGCPNPCLSTCSNSPKISSVAPARADGAQPGLCMADGVHRGEFHHS